MEQQAILEQSQQVNLAPAFKTFEEKGIGRVIKDQNNAIVGHILFPSLPSGLTPPTYDIAVTATNGDVVVLDFGFILSGHRPDFDKLFTNTEGQTLTIKEGGNIINIVKSLKEDQGYIATANSTLKSAKVGDSAIDYRNGLLKEALERRRQVEDTVQLRKKSADSLMSLLNSYFPDTNQSSATASTLSSPTPQPGPAV